MKSWLRNEGGGGDPEEQRVVGRVGLGSWNGGGHVSGPRWRDVMWTCTKECVVWIILPSRQSHGMSVPQEFENALANLRSTLHWSLRAPDM